MDLCHCDQYLFSTRCTGVSPAESMVANPTAERALRCSNFDAAAQSLEGPVGLVFAKKCKVSGLSGLARVELCSFSKRL